MLRLRKVAVKVIHLEVDPTDQQAVDATLRHILREVDAIAHLDHHPYILPLSDYGQEQVEDALLAYLVMPYREEGSLLTWLRKRAQNPLTSQLTLKQVIHLIGQAASALQYAHSHQIVHRDVKPANFLIRSQQVPDDFPDLLLTDFGIARLGYTATTTSQGIRGTPAYMAPEQWGGQAVPASDQYALVGHLPSPSMFPTRL